MDAPRALLKRPGGRARLLVLASFAAMLTPAVALAGEAQTTSSDPQTPPSSQPTAEPARAPPSDVIVTAPKGAVRSGIAQKRRADLILDSVSAIDAAKLPDLSLAEALQRVPGVSIVRFGVADPDAPGGVAVRGLTQVATTLNGRESFSANSGRGLLWEDVTPELMAGVDVYKSFAADQLEGGIGGAINLRTHMPFDFRKETLTGSLSYGGGARMGDAEPSGSLLYARRWNGPLGRVGLVLDVARASSGSRNEQVQVDPYLPQLVGGERVQAPSGFSWRRSRNDQTRTGLYEALQWAPSDEVVLFQTAFRSRYGRGGVALSASDSNGVKQTASPDGAIFNLDGRLLSGRLVLDGTNPLPCANGGGRCSAFTTTASAATGRSQTSDLTVGGDWTRGDHLKLQAALQYVESTAAGSSTDLSAQTAVSGFQFDASGAVPSLSVGAAEGLTDPARYIWYATMDHVEQHRGREIAFNSDMDYRLSRTGFFRALKLGVRAADRRQDDVQSSYNWLPLTPSWNYPNVRYLVDAAPGDVEVERFSGFLGGRARLPERVVFPSLSLVRGGDIAAYHARYGQPGDLQGPAGLEPSRASHAQVRTGAAYALARFADDDLFGVPTSGNLGVRVVHETRRSDGFIALPTGQIMYEGVQASLPGGHTATTGRGEETEVLPSLNLLLLPRRDLQLRLGASRSMAAPSFGATRAAGSIGVVADPVTRAIAYATSDAGDPSLKPELSTNLDLSLEWSLPHEGLLHLALFRKAIDNYMTYGVYSEEIALTMPDGARRTFPGAMTNVFNSDQPATLQGLEVGLTRKLDFLPHPLDGLALTANYTLIDSSSPSDLAYDTTGSRIENLPADQLSRDNYNLVGFYEKGDWSVRVGYAWRSRYLLSPGGYGTTGSYYNQAVGQTVIYSLPVYAEAYGQLDLGATYRLSDRVALSVQAQNVTGAMQETLMGAGPDQVGRSWSLNDRRVVAALRFTLAR